MTIVQEAAKKCSKCELEKPITDFHRMSSSKDGRRPQCKACRYPNPRPDTAVVDGMKTCTKCGETKKTEEYSKDKRGKDGLRSRCKACRSEEFSFIPGPGYYAKANREWRRAYPDRARAKDQKSAARKKNANSDDHTEAQVFERWGEFCYLCGVRVAIDGVRIKGLYEKEHVIPYALGGDNIIENVRPSCESCNGRKLAKPLLLFLYQRTQDQLQSGELVLAPEDEDWYRKHCEEIELAV